ncbi:hypothetical protein Nepgr_017416 [Nepenthes gracilis]|uniref:Uncharacterized protein n=1 Tax=Nepenthes gracilis TaxID=150966 RepID=A0AAD3SPD9_NEPGR|nr:hypothetical protein Nepgr_017416 [Nepenthes gracilis]
MDPGYLASTSRTSQANSDGSTRVAVREYLQGRRADKKRSSARLITADSAPSSQLSSSKTAADKKLPSIAATGIGNIYQSGQNAQSSQTSTSNSKICSQLPANSSSITTNEPHTTIGEYWPSENYICHVGRPAKANLATSANIQTGKIRGEDPIRRMGGAGILSAMNLT